MFEVLPEAQMIAGTADALVDGKAVGWFQGRMEFGPRALGGRSILGDARSPSMQKLLNLKVKYREIFRPFAPSVLREHVADWFELDDDSPYMLLVADVVESRRRLMNEDEEALFGIDKLNVVRSEIPAVTHVDYSARIQTVHADTNPRYHAPARRLQPAHRLPGAGQHQLQRARRADRLHARGRLPLLHGHRDRALGRRRLHAPQGPPGRHAESHPSMPPAAGLAKRHRRDLLVVIGDSVPYNAPEDCPGCTGFVDGYAKVIETHTGLQVDVANHSRHDGAGTADIEEQLASGELTELLGSADIVLISMGLNDRPPYDRSRPCGVDGLETEAEFFAAVIATTTECSSIR